MQFILPTLIPSLQFTPPVSPFRKGQASMGIYTAWHNKLT